MLDLTDYWFNFHRYSTFTNMFSIYKSPLLPMTYPDYKVLLYISVNHKVEYTVESVSCQYTSQTFRYTMKIGNVNV